MTIGSRATKLAVRQSGPPEAPRVIVTASPPLRTPGERRQVRSNRGELDLERLMRGDNQVAAARLRELHGVGRWTAEYVLLRGLGRLNVVYFHLLLDGLSRSVRLQSS